jgi:apolipoprotein N-acyltransferase
MRRRLPGLLPLLLIIVGELFFYFFPPFWAPDQKSTGNFLFLAYLIGHGMWFYALLKHQGRELAFDVYRIPELMFVFGSALFLFAYIFATNANMTYAQLFAETHGNLSLAPNSTVQRRGVMLRFIPFLLYDGGVYLFFRIHKASRFRRLLCPRGERVLEKGGKAPGAGVPSGEKKLQGGRPPVRWALAVAILSGLLSTLSFPSFVSVHGFGFLGFFALVPLWYLFLREKTVWALFYGLTFAVFQALLTYYWLGTFSLITLQLVSVFLFLEYLLLFLALLLPARRITRPHLWLFPAAWTIFDFLRTQGFFGFPWGMPGTVLYRWPLLIQIADIGGVYLVSFFVLLTNGLLLEIFMSLFFRKNRKTERCGPAAPVLRPILALALLWTAVLTYGSLRLSQMEGMSPEKTVKIALIQPNTDPRRSDYRSTFETLKKITDRSLAWKPDLIAWPETAFVPNIRKWSTLDPEVYSLSRLVFDFLEYQKSTGTWLVTGNDDYVEKTLPDGSIDATHYNASVLFTEDGTRAATYRKIHLVPFSEYFPYEEDMPWVYDILEGLDLELWEKGDRRVVFRHEDFTFSTPICFEDSFPGEVRQFVLGGAEVILNLSNDYWSLTETEGEQHFANALFRAVETRRPLLRATTSGRTASVSFTGRILRELPFYQEALVLADVDLYDTPPSLYLRFGNWFILFLALSLAGIFAYLIIESADKRC